MVNRNLYKLVEGHGEGCDGCALLDMCDEIADSLNLIEYMCCAEEEDFEKFENPIYIEKTKEENLRLKKLLQKNNILDKE